MKRAIYDNMFKASNEVPFQGKGEHFAHKNLLLTMMYISDIVLVSLWAVLTFFGLSIQIYASLDRPAFPSASSSPVYRRHSSSRSRSRRSKSRRAKSRAKRLRAAATVPIDDVLVIANGRRSVARPAVPLTVENADENQPLLYVFEAPSSAIRTPERHPSGYNAI